MHSVTTPRAVRGVILPLGILFAVGFCMIRFPLLAIPMAVLMPLVVCPARISVGTWFALVLPLLPCIGLFYAGIPPVFFVGMILPFSYLSLMASSIAQRNRFDMGKTAVFHIGAMLAAVALGCAQLAFWLGGSVPGGLAEFMVRLIREQPNANVYLYAMVQNGFLRLPSSVNEVLAGALGQWLFVLPSLQTELFNALRFQLLVVFQQGLPTLLVQVCVVVGFFSALNTVRVRAKQQPEALWIIYRTEDGEVKQAARVMPSFRAFHLPESYRHGLWVMMLVVLLLMCYGSGGTVQVLCTMLMALVMIVYELLGAAVLVFLATRRNEKRAVMAGVFAGVLMLLFPTALMVLGISDQIFHLRIAALVHQKQKEE